MEVWLHAPVFGQSGYEVLSRGIALSLHKLGIRVHIEQKYGWNMEKCFLSNEDNERLVTMCNTSVSSNAVHILQQFPHVEYLESDIAKKAKKKYCFSLFETDRCPMPWVSLLNKMTETWVFSKFNKETYTKSGVNNVQILPFAIDNNIFNEKVVPFDFGKKEGQYVFLTNGDFTERKNFEGLIEAFVTTFTDKDNVVLIIKSHSNGFIKRFQLDCERRFKEIVNRFNSINPPEVLFLGDKLPWYAVPSFYTAGDCFVLVSRGEGLGLPYLESLACRVPCIATSFGGQLQFLDEDNSLLVGCETKVIDDMEYIRKCLWALNHKWAYIYLEDLKNKLRFAYEFRDIMRLKGKRGQEKIKEMTWQKVGLKIIERIQS